MTYQTPQLLPLDHLVDVAGCKPTTRPCYTFLSVGDTRFCFAGRGVFVNGQGSGPSAPNVTAPVPTLPQAPDAPSVPTFDAPLVLP